LHDQQEQVTSEGAISDQSINHKTFLSAIKHSISFSSVIFIASRRSKKVLQEEHRWTHDLRTVHPPSTFIIVIIIQVNQIFVHWPFQVETLFSSRLLLFQRLPAVESPKSCLACFMDHFDGDDDRQITSSIGEYPLLHVRVE
jgi:hypothetical protein